MGYIDAPAGNPAFSTSSNLIPLAKIFNTVCSVAKHFAIKARKYLLRFFYFFGLGFSRKRARKSRFLSGGKMLSVRVWKQG